MPNKKVSQLNAGSAPDGSEYIPGVQGGGSVKFLLSMLKSFFGMQAFTPLSGTTWNGSNKTLLLTSNTALTFASTNRSGILRVKQDSTGSRTLTINTASVAIASAANSISVISFFYDDIAGSYVFSVDTNIVGNITGGGVAPSAPTTGVVDDSANTFNWTNNPSFTALSDYEFTLDGGSTYTTVSAKPIVVGNVNKAIGQVGLRVKAVGGNPASSTLFNASAFTASGSYDTNAQAYMDAITGTGATLSTPEKNALNQLVLDLKSASAWTNMMAFGTPLGGTANAHKINGKTATNILTYSSPDAPTHDGFGINFPDNPSLSEYASTGIAGNTLVQDGYAFGFYSRTNSTGGNFNNYDMGASDGSLWLCLSARNGSNLTQGFSGGSDAPSVANSDSQGMFSQAAYSNTLLKLRKNAAITFTDNTDRSAQGLPSTPILLGGATTDGIHGCQRPITVWYVYGAAVDDTKHAAIDNAFITFLTTLSLL